MNANATLGPLLRDWRQQRRLSQLELAGDAEISARHLSFVETGRSRPSRALILRFGELLQLPLRERNRLLLAGGFAPQFCEHDWNDPALAGAREAVQRVITAHEPFPALAVDRHWNMLLSNRTAQRLLQGVAPELLTPTANVLRITLHPRGLGPAIINLGPWRRHLLHRLHRQASSLRDPQLDALLAELSAYPLLPGESDDGELESPMPDVVVLFRVRSELGELALFSTLTVFGTPTDVTLSEIAIEAFFPADQATAERLRQLAG